MATQIEFNNSLVNLQVGKQFIADITQWVNGVQVATDSFAVCTNGSIHADSGFFPINGKYISKTIVNVTSMCDSTSLKFEQVVRDNDLNVYDDKIITITSTGTYQITQSWHRTPNNPIYLEQLHKLNTRNRGQPVYTPSGSHS